MKKAFVGVLVFVGLAGAALAGSAPALAQAVTPPRGANIESVAASGTGCSSGGVVASFSSDRRSLIVAIAPGQLEARVGPGVPLSLSTSNCRIQLDLGVPRGYRFAIESVTYRGNGYLDPSVLARHNTRYWFQGTRTVARMASLTGPAHGQYEVSADFGAAAVASLCGLDRPLLLDTTIGMTNLVNPRGYGWVSGGMTIVYSLSWESCGG